MSNLNKTGHNFVFLIHSKLPKRSPISLKNIIT